MITIAESAAITHADLPPEGMRVEGRRWVYLADGRKVPIARLPAPLRGMICPSSWDVRWTDHPSLPDADAWWADQPYTYEQEAWICGWRDYRDGHPEPEHPSASRAGYAAARESAAWGAVLL